MADGARLDHEAIYTTVVRGQLDRLCPGATGMEDARLVVHRLDVPEVPRT